MCRSIRNLRDIAVRTSCAAATLISLAFAAPPDAAAQTTTNLAALRGLAPFGELLNTDRGRAALASNLTITGAIQHGTAHQPLLVPFPAQQQQALRDAYITGANALDLSDGLGTALATPYASLAACSSADDGLTSSCTMSLGSVAGLIGYAATLAGADASSGKYFFANETVISKSGAVPVSAEAAAILSVPSGTTDVFGKAYHHPAGSEGADPAGDSRPFQTEPDTLTFLGTDYFGVKNSNQVYLRGPLQDLTASPAFPSGHTTYGYTESLILALLVPQRYPEMVARAAEYGNDRIILGAHYAMDVIAGRTLAAYDLAHLLANDPLYVGKQFGRFTLPDATSAVAAARDDLQKALAAGCGAPIATCASNDSGRFRDPGVTAAFYESTQTYGLPVVYPATAAAPEDVAAKAPEAGYLLTAAFPSLTLAQADAILTQTEGPGGGFLDDGSAFGIYSRLDLYKASVTALAATP